MYLAKKKLAPSSLMGWQSGGDILMEHPEAVGELNSNDNLLPSRELEEVTMDLHGTIMGCACSKLRALRARLVDWSRKMTSLRFR